MRDLARRRPLLTYTLARAGLFVLALAVLWLLQLRGLWLVVGAALLSGTASIFLLSGQRDVLSSRVAERVDRSRAQLSESASAEDAEDDHRRDSAGP